MYTDMLPQPWPFCNTTASWNAKLDVCSSHLFLRVLGTQAIVWLGRRQILLSGGFLWMCKRIWRIYCALLWFSLSLMFVFANGTGRSKISRGHWTLVLVSAWFLPVDKVSSYTNHLNLGLLERRRTSGSLLMASTKIYVKCQLNIHHRRLQILSTSTPVDTSDQQRRDDQPMPVRSTISTVVKTKMK